MPYFHKHCNGKIGLWNRKCSKCGKKWPISAWFRYPPPKDMTRYIVGQRTGPTTYSRWIDRIPLANIIPRALPNWPRWARIFVLVLLVGVVILIIFLVRGF